MNKLLLTSAISLAMASATAFAHHPAADSVPTEIYEMINDNISEQHLALDFDDMGGYSAELDAPMESQSVESGPGNARD